ncbi:uncharacterized protein LOC5510655 isoform X3 [Nematostella vectensis]|uniref:uncharacterized protein LOC5510655 isoform X3 n=1 Tax=Nematostella vectensis TaxID=45351 RepID=UPI00138FF96B|nr:uncharacterized protein LOC5510655 isoform X3 [Nematostella vectensis]
MVRLNQISRCIKVLAITWTVLLLPINSQGSEISGEITSFTNLTQANSPYIVTDDIIILKDATLHIQPGTTLEFAAGVGIKVKEGGVLLAQGSPNERITLQMIQTNYSSIDVNKNETIPYNPGIRLAEGADYRTGRLEVFINGQWGTVCDDLWDMQDTQVACKHLGFLGAIRYYRHASGRGPVWLDDVTCKGSEQSLLECSHRGIGSHNCGRRRDVGIECFTLLAFVATKSMWSGIDYAASTSPSPSPLRYVDIAKAFAAVKGKKTLPDLHHVTSKDCGRGVHSDGLETPLTIKNCVFAGSMVRGIDVVSGHVSLTIRDTLVVNTTNGGGLGIRQGAGAEWKELTAADEKSGGYPMRLRARGQGGRRLEVVKVFNTSKGYRFTLHFQSLSGNGFDVTVRDGDSVNGTILTTASQADAGQVPRSAVTTSNRLWVQFVHTGSYNTEVKIFITHNKDPPSLTITNSKFLDNRGTGLSVEDFIGHMDITNTEFIGNQGHGMFAKKVAGTITGAGVECISNTVEGLMIQYSSITGCSLRNFKGIGNKQNGIFAQISSLDCKLQDACLVKNSADGSRGDRVAGFVEFDNATVSMNQGYGIMLYDGPASLRVTNSRLSKNKIDGCHLANQGGEYSFDSCAIKDNGRSGIVSVDIQAYRSNIARRQFTMFILNNSQVDSNREYGVRVMPTCEFVSSSEQNVSIAVLQSSISNNTNGGLTISPDSCRWYINSYRHRRVTAQITGNVFSTNKGFAVMSSAIAFLGLQAEICNNSFLNTTGSAVTVYDQSKFEPTRQATPVSVNITRNTFTHSRGDRVVYVDFVGYPNVRISIIANNSFASNTGHLKFRRLFRRATSYGVVVLEVGTFRVQGNLFSDNSHSKLLASMHYNHRNVIDARYNWWDTKDECLIQDRIQDFHTRAQLATADYFPYLLSEDRLDLVTLDIPRKMCFLRGDTIGGALDRDLELPSQYATYKVRDDLVVSRNISLKISSNTTLFFPPRSLFLVQGNVQVIGTREEKVRFVQESPEEKIRLVDGAGPWDGRVEIYFNRTWMSLCLGYRGFSTEGTILCQQLGYERFITYKNIWKSGRESYFIHNLQCGSLDEDIMGCNNDKWGYGSDCGGYVAHVVCQRNYWSGIHIAMGNSQSSLHHLEIHDAGYPYRGDISLPGSALRIDYDIHNISNIRINSSASRGVNVVHLSPFLSKSLMPDSDISHTESYGIWAGSPYVRVSDVRIWASKGPGVGYHNPWDVSYTHVPHMASPGVYTIRDICDRNRTFVTKDTVTYMTSSYGGNPGLSCDHVFVSDKGFKIAVQVVYLSFDTRYSSLRMYDGDDGSSSMIWNLNPASWASRQTFNSTSERMLFRLYKRNGYALSFHLLVFSVADDVQPITSTVEITNSIFDSNNNPGGISIVGSNHLEDLLIRNCSISRSLGAGLSINLGHLTRGVVSSCVLDNNNQGISLNKFAGSIEIVNSTVNGSRANGIWIETGDRKFVRILNSSITKSGERAVKLDGSNRYMRVDLSAQNSVFAYNKLGCLYSFVSYYHSSYSARVEFASCQIIQNRHVTIDIAQGFPGTEWLFTGNTFLGNAGTAVIRSGSGSSGSGPLLLKSNKFFRNKCNPNAVIDILKKATKLVVSENMFAYNDGGIVFLRETAANGPVYISNNVFTDNTCYELAVITARRLEDVTSITENTFQLNTGRNVLMLQSVHTLPQPTKNLTLVDNTLSNNNYTSWMMSGSGSCAVTLSGMLQHKTTRFWHNRFVNPDFDQEFCISVPARSQRNRLDVSHNWWGSRTAQDVADRVLDFDDNFDLFSLDFRPFLLSANDFDRVSAGQSTSGLQGAKLMGRLYESTTLTEEASPYEITSDVTILPNVTLTIEPNVELKFKAGTSLLVLGTLNAKGTFNKNIKFTLLRPSGKETLRLRDGTYPWEGTLEILQENNWYPVCWSDQWTIRDTHVVCKQLGYVSESKKYSWSKAHLERMDSLPYQLTCSGNESSYDECEQTALLNASCVAKTYVQITCEARPWGNIRFVAHNESWDIQQQSVLEHARFTYCGKHARQDVACIEMVQTSPVLNNIEILNSTGDGVKSLPNSDTHIFDSKLANLGGDGLVFVQTEKDVKLENLKVTKVAKGVVFYEPNEVVMSGVHYGKLSICDAVASLLITGPTLIYFDLPGLISASSPLSCSKLIRVEPGKGVRIRLLYHSVTSHVVRLYSDVGGPVLVDRSGDDVRSLVHKDIFVVKDKALLWWSGNVNSKVMFEVDSFDLDSKYNPCTFDTGMCGWQTFDNLTINGVNMTMKWRVTDDWHTYQAGSDHSYYHNQGNLLYVGNTRWPSLTGRSALVSRTVSRGSNICSLVFYYRLGRDGRSALELFRRKGYSVFSGSTEFTPLWKPPHPKVLDWTKVILDLQDLDDDYVLVFVGSYNKTSNYHYRNFVTLDDIHFVGCDRETRHELLNSELTNHREHGILYESTTSVTRRASIHRCTIIGNGESDTQEASGGVAGDTVDMTVSLTNNYITGNPGGGVHLKIKTSEGKRKTGSLIYGNTLLENEKEAVFLESSNLESLGNVGLRDNVFGSNAGTGFQNAQHSTLKILNVATSIHGNLFYNNSGLFTMEYTFSDKKVRQKCENNHFFLNYGTANDYGATIRTNGPLEYHGNSLKNPYNLYELDTTLSAVSDPVNATRNWFGFGLKPTVESRIRDNEDDYRLPLVLFEPFNRIQPRNRFSFGCPADWMNAGATCFVYRPGARTYHQADHYCKYYGGHLLSLESSGDRLLLASLMSNKRPDGKPPVPVWVLNETDTPSGHALRLFTPDGRVKSVSNQSLYPFGCSRSAVVRCPNGCFHNGDCIGSTCFCYRGWTGHDCSQFHCRDVHECSGFGTCVGPNVCKCMTGFLGRGCTYSYCGKYTRCNTCNQDPNCGWCDSAQQCMPGNQTRPHQEPCPDWFYHNCYTVGSENHCSRKIQHVDCTRKQCNFTRPDTNKESCQTCNDLEMCYNREEEGKCRSWNTTRCPDGFVKVDYSNTSRINNTVLHGNVIVIDANATTLYNCPVLLPGQDEATPIIIAPRDLGVKAGQIIASKQAGGIMHKVNQTDDIGPYMVMLTSRAKIEEVVQYADFSEKVIPEPIMDEVTEDESPDMKDLSGLMTGRVTLNGNVTLQKISTDVNVFKCVGHMYEIGVDTYSKSYYLVMDRASAVETEPGDVVIAPESHGFLERVTHLNQTEHALFIQTTLERCSQDTTWSRRFKPRRPANDEDIICTGGDNNPGLVITDLNSELKDISINDTIAGRRSKPVLAKVISSHTNRDYVLVEVLPVLTIVNGSAVTEAELHQLHPSRRRTRRDVDKEMFTFRKSHENSIKIPFYKGYVSITQTVTVSATFYVTMGVFTEKDHNGDLKVTDAVFGLEMHGQLISKVDLHLGVEASANLYKSEIPVIRHRQIGGDIYICIPGVCIPSAFFFDVEAREEVKVTGKAYLSFTMTSTANLAIGGICSLSSGCNKVKNGWSLHRSRDLKKLKVEAEATWDNVLVPRVTYRFPVVPSLIRNFFNRFSNLWKKIFKKFPGNSGGSISGAISILRLTLELPFGLKMVFKPCSDNCAKEQYAKTELSVSYGLSEIVGQLWAGFGTMQRELLACKGKLSPALVKNICLRCGWDPACNCPTTPATTTATTPTDTTTALSTTELSTTLTDSTTSFTGSTTPFTESTTPFTGSTTPFTGSTTPFTGSITPFTGSVTPNTDETPPTGITTQFTGSTTPFTGSTTPFTGSTTPFTGSTTPPPTTRPPCECKDGETGVLAEDGKCDCPPKCDDGRKPKFVNNRWKCPPPECGEHPACVTGRKGEGCSQPDVTPCDSSCSGNGIPVVLGDCGSRCVCMARWTGQCCETRLPDEMFGDPHLQTLDGVAYDYFGIGEFWGCRNLPGDFGYQFRFFAYERASLIGGIAIKAGKSVMTVMTIVTGRVEDMPRLRINGALINLTVDTYPGRPLKIENGSVLLDVQKPFSSPENEGAVLLLSLQFITGVSLTIDVRHSPTMGRQYLNVLFTPTAAFYGNTGGLCGDMDNNPANDFTGPTGERFTDAVQFAESWQIKERSTNDSSLYGSWSWSSSNFHPDDKMDRAYTDPFHRPRYGLEGIPQVLIQKANTICAKRDLTEDLLKSCIYDVAITNDTSMASQEILKTGCPDQCSGKGRCVNGTCQCLGGWTGENCKTGLCSNCSEHGSCIKGFCYCDVGWEGERCEHQATCYNVNNCTSPEHGVCQRTDQCLCQDGYIGVDCSIVPTCGNVSHCSGRGVCVNYDVCKCHKDWTGLDCSQNSCADLDYCSGRGSCVNAYRCECNSGWTGISCAVPDCAAVSQCSSHGDCVASNTCRCHPGYQGSRCSEVADCSSFGNCSFHGECVIDRGGNATCRCYTGFSGSECQLASCIKVKNCSNRGECFESGFCKCDVGYTGPDCSNNSCEAINYCSGHGECIAYDVCRCEPKWYGAACNIPDCTAVQECSKRGYCMAPDTCECYPGWDGPSCNKKATPNLHPPVFQSTYYNVSVVENSPPGSSVLRVNATDEDSGRNGEVRYFLATNEADMPFTVDGLSGEIVTSSVLDYEAIPRKHLYTFDVTASDNGRPMKFASTRVYVNLLDVNDNCPVFDPSIRTTYNLSVHTAPGTQLDVITTTDKDAGYNSIVIYSVSANGVIAVDAVTGSLSLIGQLLATDYHVTVMARDQGTPPCTSVLKLTVTGTQSPVPSTDPGTTVMSTRRGKMTPDAPVLSTRASFLTTPLGIITVSLGALVLLAVMAAVLIKIRLNRHPSKVADSRGGSPLVHGSRLKILSGSQCRVYPEEQLGQEDQAWLKPEAMELHRLNAQKIDF